jgi:hypothetical protein
LKAVTESTNHRLIGGQAALDCDYEKEAKQSKFAEESPGGLGQTAQTQLHGRFANLLNLRSSGQSICH